VRIQSIVVGPGRRSHHRRVVLRDAKSSSPLSSTITALLEPSPRAMVDQGGIGTHSARGVHWTAL
jgi:hypothetical protein